jgi:hypothetical protein
MSFVTSDGARAELFGGTWDVACSRSTSARTAATVMAFGRLAVLYTDSSKNELYLCDLPPR